MTNASTKIEREDQRRQFVLRGNPARMAGFPANINRHTGKPHEHRAEIARRLRQQA